MFNRGKFSKALFWIAGVLGAVVFILMAMHVYLGARYFDYGRNFFPPAAQFLNPGADEFSFAVMSDTGDNNLVLEKIIRRTRRSSENHQFILYLGDLVMNRDEANFYWMLSELRPNMRRMPFYMVPGNHDVERGDNVDKSFYRSVMGATYYWFAYGNVLFIGLDTSGHYIDVPQLAWLDNTLAKVRPMFRHCIIYSHRPPVVPPGMPNHKLDDESIRKLRLILEKYDIDAMFFGHVHYFSSQKFADIPVYTTPTGGQGSRVDDRFGYISVKIGRNGIESVQPKYVNFSGPEREHFEILWVDNVLSRKFRRLLTIMLVLGAVCVAGGLVLRRHVR